MQQTKIKVNANVLKRKSLDVMSAQFESLDEKIQRMRLHELESEKPVEIESVSSNINLNSKMDLEFDPPHE